MKNIQSLNTLVATKHRTTDLQSVSLGNNDNHFNNLPKLATAKSYVTLASCVVDHIITTDALTDREKLFYLVADSLASIRNKSGKERSMALSAEKWMKRLGCSKGFVFSMQKSLAEKGYFSVTKDKTESGRDKRNIIVPTLPDLVFNDLLESSKNISDDLKDFEVGVDTKRGYLDRTRLFIKINYQLLKAIVLDENISSFQKVIWLDLFTKCYIIGKHSKACKTSNPNLTASYKELSIRYNCNQSHLSQTLGSLKKLSYLKAEQFYVHSGPAINDRCDKSLWRISPTLPQNLVHLLPKHGYEVSETGVNSNDDSDNFPDDGFSNPYPRITKPLLNKDFKEKKINNRSTENENFSNSNYSSESQQSRSNFSKNDLDLKKSDNEKKPVPSFGKAMELKDFYPLNEIECLELQQISGRRFDLNVMNEILRSMAARLKEKAFKTKKAFMNYMAKVFANELRSEEKVNNVNFKIIAKGSEEERIARREKFLTEIENSLQASPEWHFKKRLTSVLSSDKAYDVLKAYMGVGVEDGVFTLELNKYIKLSNSEKEIVLSHAKSTHDGVVTDNEVKIFVKALRINMPEREKSRGVVSNNEYEPVFEANIWGDIRKGLVGTLGKYVDKHWFSKINVEIDEHSKLLKLKASNNFVLDWVKQHYSHRIETIARGLGFNTSFYDQLGKMV